MLNRFVLKNFRSLVDVDVTMKPLTVLIGPNDSGKTSFLKALQKLANQETIDRKYDSWRLDPDSYVAIIGWEPGGAKCENSTRDRTTPLPSIIPAGYFQLPSDGIDTTSAGYNDEAGPQLLTDKGWGVPGLMDYLLRRDRDRFFGAVESMKQHIEGLQDLHIGTPNPHERNLNFKIDNGLVLPGDKTSAGVRLMMFFVALTYHPSPPKLILIEEPEMGVHPKRLKDIVGLMREITKGVHGGHAAQIVLTTHSPYLLDSIDPRQDQVLVFRRNNDGSRSVTPVDTEGLKVFLDEFMLGEIWYNEGEEGLIKK